MPPLIRGGFSFSKSEAIDGNIRSFEKSKSGPCRCWTQRTERPFARFGLLRGFTLSELNHNAPAWAALAESGDEEKYSPFVPTFPKAPVELLR